MWNVDINIMWKKSKRIKIFFLFFKLKYYFIHSIYLHCAIIPGIILTTHTEQGNHLILDYTRQNKK